MTVDEKSERIVVIDMSTCMNLTTKYVLKIRHLYGRYQNTGKYNFSNKNDIGRENDLFFLCMIIYEINEYVFIYGNLNNFHFLNRLFFKQIFRTKVFEFYLFIYFIIGI